MKKISKLAGIVAAAALLCGISGCDNTETITMTSASIEMVGDPVKTDKAVVFQWKESVAYKDIQITRQAPGEEELTISNDREGWIKNGFVDRVTDKNLLKAGVEYTYRFYNKSDVSSARTTEYTYEKKYSCVERKVKFDSIAAAGTKLTPITKEQVTIVKSETKNINYLSVYVDEKESKVWINLREKATGKNVIDKYDPEIGGIEFEEYDPTIDYEIWVGKWWPGDGEEEDKYYSNADTGISFELPATVAEKSNDVYLHIEEWNDSVKVTWSGKKDITYALSFEAFDNKGNAVTLKKSTVDASAIKHDDFYNYEFTGKVSDFITLDATTHKTSIKTVKAILKGTAKDKTASESEDETEIAADATTYTKLDSHQEWIEDGYWDSNRNQWISYTYPITVNDLSVDNISSSIRQDDGYYKTEYKAIVSLRGANLPETAKLYYKSHWDALYTEYKDGLKKNSDGDLVATVPFDKDGYYDFKAVVTVDNAKWYDWEEGKTEEVATKDYEHIYIIYQY